MSKFFCDVNFFFSRMHVIYSLVSEIDMGYLSSLTTWINWVSTVKPRPRWLKAKVVNNFIQVPAFCVLLSLE